VTVLFGTLVAVITGSRLSNRHHQASVLNALEPNETPGELFYLGRLPMNDQRFKTRIMIDAAKPPFVTVK